MTLATTLDQLDGVMNAGTGEVGPVTAINPRTGLREQVYAGGVTRQRFDEDGRPLPMSVEDQNVYFLNDPDRPADTGPMFNPGVRAEQ